MSTKRAKTFKHPLFFNARTQVSNLDEHIGLVYGMITDGGFSEVDQGCLLDELKESLDKWADDLNKETMFMRS